MLTWLRSRSRPGVTASGLYGSIVTQARVPKFYTVNGVPDTMEGRFGVIAVHMYLVLDRIRQQGTDGDEVARALLETFMTDMDDNMREIGIGDVGVPRRVKKAAAALHEQVEAYTSAMAASDDTALKLALTTYIMLGDGRHDVSGLAHYVRSVAASLIPQSWSEIGAGRITFPTV